jgi:hypothetical protein
VAVEFVWISLFVAVMVGMWWFAYRMEPHWSTKDGKRFLCSAQEIEKNTTIGRPREPRVMVLPDGLLHISQKRMMRRKHSRWMLVGKSPDAPKKVHLYLAQLRQDGNNLPATLALRIPTKSRVAPVLDAILAERDLATSRPAARNSRPADPPDPD